MGCCVCLPGMAECARDRRPTLLIPEFSLLPLKRFNQHHKASTTESKRHTLRESKQNQNVHASQFLTLNPVRLCSVFLTHCRVELSTFQITLLMPESLGHRDLLIPRSTPHHTPAHRNPPNPEPSGLHKAFFTNFFQNFKTPFPPHPETHENAKTSITAYDSPQTSTET